ncbi:hypothetical protein SCHPADRAFT_930230 [Schizopora paradoxa]|uniref:BTB domain-containing protein n=1 Tax=Schizopora paradoxa TaxID=27342 RepID=A0A0H2RGI2_9AGAM|nr:hypothetical protein SCHPADRAFT_930230 [Schizopora paradoxa]
MSTTQTATLHSNYEAEDGDVVLVSSDNVQFRVHSRILREASSVFKDMACMPAPQDEQLSDRIIKFEEPAYVVEFLMDAIYPREVFPSVANYAQAWEIAKAADKYEIGRAHTVLQGSLIENEAFGQPLRLYKLACFYEWKKAIAWSSKASLNKPLLKLSNMKSEDRKSLMELTDAELEAPMKLHKSRNAEILRHDPTVISRFNCLEDIPDGDNGGEPAFETVWRCPAVGCGGRGNNEKICAAWVSFKRGFGEYLDSEPAAPALYDRNAFGILFRSLVRTSGFEWLDCNECSESFASEERAWRHYERIGRCIPRTVYEKVLVFPRES